jgi:hypothetical protein
MEKCAQVHRTKCTPALFVEILPIASMLSGSTRRKFVLKWHTFQRRCANIGERDIVKKEICAFTVMLASNKNLLRTPHLKQAQVTGLQPAITARAVPGWPREIADTSIRAWESRSQLPRDLSLCSDKAKLQEIRMSPKRKCVILIGSVPILYVASSTLRMRVFAHREDRIGLK